MSPTTTSPLRRALATRDSAIVGDVMGSHVTLEKGLDRARIHIFTQATCPGGCPVTEGSERADETCETKSWTRVEVPRYYQSEDACLESTIADNQA